MLTSAAVIVLEACMGSEGGNQHSCRRNRDYTIMAESLGSITPTNSGENVLRRPFSFYRSTQHAIEIGEKRGMGIVPSLLVVLSRRVHRFNASVIAENN